MVLKLIQRLLLVGAWCVLAGCVPTPARLQAHLVDLDARATAIATSHQRECQPSAVAPGQARHCSGLVSCLTALQRAAGACQEAIGAGGTVGDEDYRLKARACELGLQVAAPLCPSPLFSRGKP